MDININNPIYYKLLTKEKEFSAGYDIKSRSVYLRSFKIVFIIYFSGLSCSCWCRLPLLPVEFLSVEDSSVHLVPYVLNTLLFP